MNPQIDLIYVSDTGHILSAFTRAARPQQPETAPDAFIGAGLHVQGLEQPPSAAPFTDYNNEDFVMPSEHLAFFSTDQTPSVLAAPRGSYLDTSNNLQSLTPLTGAVLTVASSVLTITLTSAVTSLKYLVLIAQQSQGTPATPLTGSITGTTATGAVPTLSPGSYYALLFLATYFVQVFPITIV